MQTQRCCIRDAVASRREAGLLIQARFGLHVEPRWISPSELRLLAAVVGVGLLASLVRGYRAYRLSLADGLTPRI